MKKEERIKLENKVKELSKPTDSIVKALTKLKIEYETKLNIINKELEIIENGLD